MLFPVIGFSVVALAIGFQVRVAKRNRQLNAVSWDDLVARLQSVDVSGLGEIADCYLRPNSQQLRIEPGTMWQVVGGFEGVQKLVRNADTMLELAMYAERWNDATGAAISEIMRRDAERLRKAVRTIELSVLTGRGLTYFGMELQEAIASYFLLRARLLGMYGECHAGLLPRLASAV